MTTYGDGIATALNGSAASGSGLWAFFLLFLAVGVLIAGVVILLRSIQTGIRAM